MDQQATRRRPIQPGATIYPGRLKGSQGVTPFLKVTDNDVMRVLKKLESSAIPRSRINGDPQFLLSAFIGLLGDHRRFRRPRTAVEAREILDSIIPTLNI